VIVATVVVWQWRNQASRPGGWTGLELGHYRKVENLGGRTGQRTRRKGVTECARRSRY